MSAILRPVVDDQSVFSPIGEGLYSYTVCIAK